MPLRAPLAPAPPAKKDDVAPGKKEGGAAAANGKADAKKGGFDANAAAGAAPPAAGTSKKIKAKPGKTPAPAAAAAATPTRAPDAYDLLDVRVGRILSAAKHPDADKLYVETIDFGEDAPRTVVSGLATHVPLDALADRLVVCVCNLKSAAMRGVTSAAIVLCGVGDTTDPINPPPGAAVGDKVMVAGYDGEPEAVINPKKKKTFEEVAAHFATTAEGVCTYKGTPLTVKGEAVTSAVINGKIQ